MHLIPLLNTHAPICLPIWVNIVFIDPEKSVSYISKWKIYIFLSDIWLHMNKMLNIRLSKNILYAMFETNQKWWFYLIYYFLSQAIFSKCHSIWNCMCENKIRLFMFSFEDGLWMWKSWIQRSYFLYVYEFFLFLKPFF